MKLFSTYKLGPITLQNRSVMAPMTRSRATKNIPNDLMAEYYGQRSSAGLIITEGVSPSPNGLGYARIPGAFSKEQVAGWKKVAAAAHTGGAKIFMQLMHTGRVSHPANMPAGSRVLAPSAVALEGEMYTDALGMQPYPVPEKMTLEDIERTQSEYVKAAQNAMTAGFDGVELHGANGYLIDQFNNTASNKRQDSYGGSIQNRARFALETAQKVAQAIGPEHTAIRLSPYGVFNGMEHFADLEEQFIYLAQVLEKLKLAYLHLVDHSSMGAPEVPQSIRDAMRTAFKGTFIASGGFDKERAEQVLESGQADLVAFGRPFLATPDLVERLDKDLPLNTPDFDTFYTPGEKGYTDYPIAGQ